MAVTAELLVFSGNPDPEFMLDDAEAAQLAALVAQCVAAGGASTDQAEPAVLGYRGFKLSADSPDLGGFDLLTVTRGALVAPTSDGLISFPDLAGCEQLLLDAARARDFGDILDQLGVGGNV